jgi:hypothetical protein
MDASSTEHPSNERISVFREKKAKRKASVTDGLTIEEKKMIQKEDSRRSFSINTKPKKSKSHKKRRKRSKNSSKTKEKNNRKKISFGTIQVFEFNYTIGYQSVTDNGPPLGLSSNLVRSRNIDLATYEKERRADRPKDEEDMLLSAAIRTRILKEEGFSVDAIERAELESQLSRIHRKESVSKMQWDEWNARKERIRRKVRRWVNPKVVYTKGAQLLRLHMVEPRQ